MFIHKLFLLLHTPNALNPADSQSYPHIHFEIYQQMLLHSGSALMRFSS